MRKIIVIENGIPVHSEDRVPEEVLQAMRSRAAAGPPVSLAKALGPTAEQQARRAAKFAEFLASKSAQEQQGEEGTDGEKGQP